MTKNQLERHVERIAKLALALTVAAGVVAVWGNGFGVMELGISAAAYAGGSALLAAILFSCARPDLMGERPFRAAAGFSICCTLFVGMAAAGTAVILNRCVPVSKAETRILTVSKLSSYRGQWLVDFTDKDGKKYTERFPSSFKSENPVGTRYAFRIRRGLFGQEFYESYEKLAASSSPVSGTLMHAVPEQHAA